MVESRKVGLNLDVLMGGGSLLGADFEFIPVSNIGLQAGMGNKLIQVRIELSPEKPHQFVVYITTILKSRIYNHFASYLGPMFIFRAKKIFQKGIGVGAILDKGPSLTQIAV